MFHYGKKQAQEVFPVNEDYRHEVYNSHDDPMGFVGFMTHRMEARRPIQEDDAMDILKQKMSALQEQKLAKS